MYVQGYGGFSWLRNQDIRISQELPALTRFDGKMDYSTGGGGGGALGYQMRSWAGELDVAYYHNSHDKFKFESNGDPVDAHGKVQTVHFMFNAYYRANNLFCNLTPYVGGGLGGAHVCQELDPSLLGMDREFTKMLSDEAVVFAYQAIAGISYCWCNWELFTEYRYRGFGDPRFHTGTIFGGEPACAVVKWRPELSGHHLNFGIRYRI